jgi:hypothetical protein
LWLSKKKKVKGDCDGLPKKEKRKKKKKPKTQAPHSEGFLVCLHGPCMQAGPGNEFGANFSASVCLLRWLCVRVMWFGLMLKPNQTKTK